MPRIDHKEGAILHQHKTPVSFQTAQEARSYVYWKLEVDVSFRRLVESSIAGSNVKSDKSVHPLVQDFLSGTARLLHNPRELPDIFPGDERVKKQLKKLQEVAMPDGTSVNVFDLLKNPNIGFEQKLRWYHAQIEPRLKWLVEKAQKPSKETQLIPPGDQDTLDPSMDEMEKSKEAPTSGFYEIAPAYGGYYKGHVYETWDVDALQWRKTPKQVQPFTELIELIESTKRTDVGTFKVDTMQAVDLPYGFVIDPASIPANEHCEIHVLQGSDGVWYIHAASKKKSRLQKLLSKNSASISLEFSIGKPKNPLSPLIDDPVEPDNVPAKLPSELFQKIQDAKTSSLDPVSKAKILCRFVRNRLEYSNESKYNDIYKQNPLEYFSTMWEQKKADCDVANTLAAEVLRQADIGVRMVAGHYAKRPLKAGTTLLHGGTGHAWLEVYDPASHRWIRMDATPKGDPDMDEEEQEEDLDPENQEGDYGEQDAEIMSDEELQKLIEELEKEERERDAMQKTPEMRYAEEAGCTPQEATDILQKIKKLRELKDIQGNNVLQESQKTWSQVLKKNMRERTVYVGPVTMHEGIDLTDPVSAWIDIRTRIDNPTGFEKPEKRVEVETAFGGFEVYIAADMSDSMNEVDPVSGQRKCHAQRDAVFLFVDSVMSNAIRAKRYAKKLKNPMPVRVCVAAFGARTEIVLPLTDEWGPKEQVRLYRALDQGAGGTTPDDVALRLLQAQIQQSSQLAQSQASPNMHRFVSVFADGGSNNTSAVRTILKSMRDDGNVVFGFGVTQSGRAMEAVYAPDAQTIPDASRLAESGIQKLVETVKMWYNV